MLTVVSQNMCLNIARDDFGRMLAETLNPRWFGALTFQKLVSPWAFWSLPAPGEREQGGFRVLHHYWSCYCDYHDGDDDYYFCFDTVTIMTVMNTTTVLFNPSH